ncbi:MAG TPA: YihY/virulence factor BrkB family protein [Terracidiphilus sp.]|nr:YihY/virulence factor BrkB family protein [Terracidiphilus sp.]
MPSPAPIVDRRLNQHERRIWEMVARSPLENLWTREGLTIGGIAKCTWQSLTEDHIFGYAAELGFYFFFSLFPTLLCATSVLGLMLRSATAVYQHLLGYIALVVPSSAFDMVLRTFHQTTAHASSGKVTFGLLVALWSASMGISATQETLNVVYKIYDRRSYLKAKVQAIGLTVILIVTITLSLTCMFGCDFLADWAHSVFGQALATVIGVAARIVGWTLAAGFIALSFALTYYWAPDMRTRRWHWLTPGAAIGMAAWLAASLGFRLYLYFFNTYSVTYGSLGAVMILLMWFYITGLTLLAGAEINCQIESAAVEARLSSPLRSGPSEPPSRDAVAPAA